MGGGDRTDAAALEAAIVVRPGPRFASSEVHVG